MDRAWSTRGAAHDRRSATSSYYFGGNIPGKPRRYLLNAGGRPKLFKEIAEVVDTDYEAFELSERVSSSRSGSLTSDGGDRGQRRAHDAGQPQRRRGEQEAAAVVLAQPRRQLVEVPHLAERHAELEQAQVVDRQERVPARVAVLAEQPLDRVVVGDQRRDLRVGDPLEQRRRRARRGTCTS